jgi:hypothetical protein
MMIPAMPRVDIPEVLSVLREVFNSYFHLFARLLCLNMKMRLDLALHTLEALCEALV